MNKIPLSATVITFNEENRIQRCIDSLQFCQEIIVVDSGSTDGTCEIARAAGAKVLVNEWTGYGVQKQFAVDQANRDWVLCLDADETVSPDLRDSIITALSGKPGYAGFRMPRCNHFLGRALRHGEGYPDFNLRLFDRKQGKWTSDAVHEHVVLSGPCGTLKGDIIHYSATSLFQYIAKQNRYTSLQAEIMFARGKKPGLARCMLSPAFRFLKFYFVRLGFLDGFPGLVHILLGCFNTFSKNAKLMELQIAQSKSTVAVDASRDHEQK